MNDETRKLIEDVAQVAAERAVKTALLTLGLDANHPLQAQREMASLREMAILVDDPEFQKDLMYVRTWRKSYEAVRTRGLITFTALIVTGLVGLLLAGVWSKIGGS